SSSSVFCFFRGRGRALTPSRAPDALAPGPNRRSGADPRRVGRPVLQQPAAVAAGAGFRSGRTPVLHRLYPAKEGAAAGGRGMADVSAPPVLPAVGGAGGAVAVFRRGSKYRLARPAQAAGLARYRAAAAG